MTNFYQVPLLFPFSRFCSIFAFSCALAGESQQQLGTSTTQQKPFRMSAPPSGRPSRSTSLSRSQPPSSVPPPVPSGYPPTSTATTSHYPPTTELQPTEQDPLAVDNSPNLQSSSTLPPGAAYDFGDPDGAYTAVNLNPISPGLGGGGDEQARYYNSLQQQHHHRDQSLDLVDSYQHNGDSGLPRTSMSTHNSRTQLRPTHGGGILPTGVDGDLEKHYDSRPIHPGASVQMGSNPQSTRAEKMYGSGAGGEKGSPTASGYNTPKNAHGRGGSRAGLGQWSSPGGGNSPYGRLGGNDESGMNSAASSNPNLQFAEGESTERPFYLGSSDRELTFHSTGQVISLLLQRIGSLELSSQFTILLSSFVGCELALARSTLPLASLTILLLPVQQHLHCSDSRNSLDSSNYRFHRCKRRSHLVCSFTLVVNLAHGSMVRLVGCRSSR